jgi:hypothetical protein
MDVASQRPGLYVRGNISYAFNQYFQFQAATG